MKLITNLTEFYNFVKFFLFDKKRSIFLFYGNMKFLFVLLPFFLLPSCKHFSSDSKKQPASYYFERAKRYKEKQNYSEALNQLFSIRKSFFDSPYNQKALLMTADIHFEQEKYPQAITGYKKYQKLYGVADQDYVLYQMSLAYKNQLPKKADYDLSLANKALLKLAGLLKLNSSYQEKALKIKQEILNKQLEKEVKTVLFFEKLGWNEAGLKRAKRLLSLHPNSHLKPKILLASVRLAEKSQQNPSAFKKELLEKYPKSAYTKSLQKRAYQNKFFIKAIKEKIL